MEASRALDCVIDEKVQTANFPTDACARTVPGLRNTKPEDPEAPADKCLNWWQASNVHILGKFLRATDKERQSEGMLLCDAPGLGKTLFALSAIVSMSPAGPAEYLCIVFKLLLLVVNEINNA